MRRRGLAIEARVDAADECIWRGDERVSVPPKAFLVLRRLMAQPNQLVTKETLLDAAWPETHVIDTVLNNAIAQLREALGDDPKRPRFIETVHRRGFRWIGPAAETASASPAIRFIDAVDLSQAETAAFVGRAESLAELGRCYARADAGQRQLVLITGEPGIGKTALVDRFVDGLAPHAKASSPNLVARGQCIESYGAGDLYRPLREAFEQLWRGGGEETRAVFRTHAPSWLLSMPELASSAELETVRRTVLPSTLESVQRELERAIETASAAHTLVLVLEDLHWSEPATVALLGALAARREPARLMILGTYRSVDAIAQQHPITRLKRELTAKRQCIELSLEGLPGDEVSAFVDRRFPEHELPIAFAARLCDQTTGNPLFLLNALADLERRGWLQEKDGAWRCTVDLDTLFAAVPESTRELIAFRLDQLEPATRALLEAASIVGETFATQTVAAATERGCAEVEAELDTLARAELFLQGGDEVVWPDGTRGCEYEFRHALYRQVLVRGITPTRRQHLHRRVALALERGYGDRVGEVADRLSVHHEQAGDAFRAVDYIEMLVQRAYARSAAHEAEVMLGHGISLLKQAPNSPARQERLLKTMIAHGIALGTVRGLGSAESLRVFDDARALGQSMPTSAEHITSLAGIVVGKLYYGHLREGRGLAEEMVALARPDEPSNVLTARLSAGLALIYLGEIEAAIQHLESAVAAIDLTSRAATEPPSASYYPAAIAVYNLGWALTLSGRSQRGLSLVQSSLQIARDRGMPLYVGWALTMIGWLAIIRRDPAGAKKLAAEALAYGEQNALPYGREMNQITLCWVDVLETRDPERIKPLREVVDSIRTTGLVFVSRAYVILAEACLAVGRIDDAAQALDAAFEARGEERYYDAERLRLRTKTLLARSDKGRSKNTRREEAEQLLQQAVQVANAQGARLLALRAAVDLCRLWRAAGKRDQAHASLSEALAGFDEGADETDLLEAGELLDKLAAG